jgi:hypothetical protein
LEAGRALFASPRHFMERLLDEFIPNRLIALGEPASSFVRLEAILWGAGSGSSGEFAKRSANSIVTIKTRSAEPMSERVI